MKMERILPFAKSLLEKAVLPGDVVIDATVGNGHDTVFLAELVGETGKVYGFDVQQEAIGATRDRLTEHGLLKGVTLFHAGHEQLSERIPIDDHGKIRGAIFNLGYLPGSDKTIVTRAETTIAAIEQLMEMMTPEGIIVLVIYHGHVEGAVERDLLLRYCQQLDQKKAHVLQYQFINQQNTPPFIVAIEKR
ncbi:methyltransferase domain-containing protein [Neobacillus sp. MM2021_6]|uniref:tRNA (mnm(5)s(2)U34)-methyltransferase n=1 Tax=Bacillaceae TaxID=186817 RepID=UPI00140BFADE|nr:MULTISPECIES: class I SAM-dependent methyltransferase [Bacillaceae]MBO0960308.1 methyltransferase domain-containing protein [Neobacillus sp. MM2021_6]NHC17418.1 methyltransferase domain-containing protein [Bacillus sp. MM2020_4]